MAALLQRGGLLAAICSVLVLAGHGTSYPPLPAAQQSRSFQAFNAKLRGSAPPMAQNVTVERLTRKRSEPQNRSTYYGIYDTAHWTRSPPRTSPG